MRWLSLFALCAGVARLVRAEVPESLSETFVVGLTLTAQFGSLTIKDNDITSLEAISSSPAFEIVAAETPLQNTLLTIILIDIAKSSDPSAQAVIHYAASNLVSPSPFGGKLTGGDVNLPYQPPTDDSAEMVFLVYTQLNGKVTLGGVEAREGFSVSLFRMANNFQLADSGLGFTLSNENGGSRDGQSLTSTSSLPSNRTTTSSMSFTTTLLPSNSTTTTSSSESSTSTSTSSTSTSTTTSTTSSTPPPPPPPGLTSYYTLSISGSTRTVIATAMNPPISTTSLPSTTTTGDPSLITDGANAGTQKAVSRSAVGLVGLSIFLIAYL